MGRRRKARESALQILFEREFNASDLDSLIRQFWTYQKASPEIRTYAEWIVRQVAVHEKDIDRRIEAASTNWRLSRMAVVDRNILRIAVCELLFEKTLVPAIVINEALEVAKKYSGEAAAVFINGVLDAVRKTMASRAPSPKEGTHERKREAIAGSARGGRRKPAR